MDLTNNRFKGLKDRLPITRGGYHQPIFARVMSVKDFIKQHNHINYCECLILPDGRIVEARPSHNIVIESLVDWLYGKPFNFYQGYYEDECFYYTGVVTVRFSEYRSFAKLTRLQERTIRLLRKHGVIASYSVGYYNQPLHQERVAPKLKEVHELREQGRLQEYAYQRGVVW